MHCVPSCCCLTTLSLRCLLRAKSLPHRHHPQTVGGVPLRFARGSKTLPIPATWSAPKMLAPPSTRCSTAPLTSTRSPARRKGALQTGRHVPRTRPPPRVLVIACGTVQSALVLMAASSARSTLLTAPRLMDSARRLRASAMTPAMFPALCFLSTGHHASPTTAALTTVAPARRVFLLISPSPAPFSPPLVTARALVCL